MQVDVNGPNASPVFKFLKENTPADMGGSADIDWNFAKWVVRLLILHSRRIALSPWKAAAQAVQKHFRLMCRYYHGLMRPAQFHWARHFSTQATRELCRSTRKASRSSDTRPHLRWSRWRAGSSMS